MIGYLREVSDSDLRQLEADRRTPDPAEALKVRGLFRRDDPRVLSLEKDWHAIHYLLNGSAEGGGDPLGFLMVGGRKVGPDLGYGPLRLLPPDFVRRLSKALDGISDAQFWERFDAQDFEAEDIYPGVWDESPDELRDGYVSLFHEMRSYVARVAKSGGPLVVAIL